MIGDRTLVRILFVEHHSAFRQAASIAMDQEPDLEVVHQAASAAEGREKMAQGGIDAALVDIPLPDDGAEELVRELRGSNPSVPVLVLSDIEERQVHERFLRAGASEVLLKGVTMADVFDAVRRLGE